MVQLQSTITVEAEWFTPEGNVTRYHFPPMTVAQVAIRGEIDLELLALRSRKRRI